jgi:hypothetical protein
VTSRGFNIPGTIPYLDPVTVCEDSICDIHAAAVVRPGEMIIVGPPPLLVDTVRPAIPNLELHTIGVDAISGVKALCASIGSDRTVLEGPVLVISTSAVADDHWGAIGVAKRM